MSKLLHGAVGPSVFHTKNRCRQKALYTQCHAQVAFSLLSTRRCRPFSNI